MVQEALKELIQLPEAKGLGLTMADLKDPEIKHALETLLEAEKEETRRRCKTDLLFLGKEILGYKDLVADDFDHPYRVIDRMLDRKLADGMNRPFNLILIPRDCLKSTLISITKNIQRILRDGNVRILITNAVLSVAEDFLSTIKQQLSENPKMIELFGNLKGRVWRNNEITVAHRTSKDKEHTIEIGSPEHTKTGKHYDFIDADDLVTRANITTPESCYGIYKYFKDLLDLLDHPNGVIDVVGTRWSFSDLYGQILDPNNPHLPYFNTLVLGCFNEDGSARFPRKLNLDRIKEIQANKNDDLEFSAQYLNDPVPSANATFKDEYFRNRYEKSSVPETLPTYILVDPASTKNKKSDFTAIIVIKVGEDGTWYIWDMINDKFKPGELGIKLYQLYKSYKPVKFCIEQVGFAAYVKLELESYMAKNQDWFKVTELEPKGRNKDDRIKALEPMFMYEKIKFPKGGIKYVSLEGREMDMVFSIKDQFLKFPSSVKKDLMDTLAYMRDVVMPNLQVAQIEQEFKGGSRLDEWEFNQRKEDVKDFGQPGYFGGEENSIYAEAKE